MLNLLEEEFIFIYHLRQGYEQFQNIPVFERKWLIDRFLEQKRKEDEHIKNINKKGKR